MQDKPRVGLVLMQTDWSVCSDAEEIVASIQSDRQTLLNRLQQHFEILGPWVVDSSDALQVCQRALRDSDFDMVLLAYQTRADDTYLVSLLQTVSPRPLVLWCYLPWRRIPRPATYAEMIRGSGPVGAFAALGTLRNLEMPFLYTFGAPDDPRLIMDLQVAGRAARVRQQLRTARFGLIPSRNDHIQVTFVDEFRLVADIGPTVHYISVTDYRKAAAALEHGQVEAYVRTIREHAAVRDVSDTTLEQAAMAALGLDRLVKHYHLDVLAVNDASPELHNTFGMRPALYPHLTGLNSTPALPDERAVKLPETIFLPEGDLGAATAAYILHLLTGSPVMFQEILFWDEVMNQLVLGHSGLQNPAIAEPSTVWVSQDHDFCRSKEGGDRSTEGAQLQFLARPGRVTLFQLRSTPKGWQAIAASGVCLEGLPWVEGYPHAILRLDSPLTHFFNHLATVGATQHWVMAYGSVLNEIEAFCEMEKIPLELLR